MLTAATDTTLLRRAADQARDAVAAGLVSGQLGSAVRR
jgi:hypothetical protein